MFCQDQERRCFLFELSESCWKPELKTLLSSRLPSLVSVTLHDFCDDDTLSLVGHHCHHLSHLHISLGPESYREQQLSDDGFSDLIDIQAVIAYCGLVTLCNLVSGGARNPERAEHR